LTTRQAPCGKVTRRLLSATTALVLCAWLYPSLAATGTDTRSDQPLDAPPMSLSVDRELPIQVIDLGAASAAASEYLPADEPASGSALDSAERPHGPRVEVMLRRIFDEAQARRPTLQQPPPDNDFNAPLAVDKSESPQDPPGVLRVDPAEAAAALPGFGADELLHYRQQMYRTDI
jgi:hypothetical protein